MLVRILLYTEPDDKRQPKGWVQSGQSAMSDLLDLKSINGLTPPVGSQDENFSSEQREEPEGFLKVFNAAVGEPTKGASNERGASTPATEEGQSLSASSGTDSLEGDPIGHLGHRDEGEEETEGGDFPIPIDLTLNLSGLVPFQGGLAPGSLPEGTSSLPHVSPEEGVQPDGAEPPRGIGAPLLTPPEGAEELPLNALPNADRSTVEAAPLEPIGIANLTPQETEGLEIFSEQGDGSGEPALQVDKGPQATMGPSEGQVERGSSPYPMTLPERVLHQKGVEKPDRIASSVGEPNRNESNETSFLKTEPVGGIEKEKSILSTLSGADQNSSGEAGVGMGSERPDPMATIANETAGMSAADVPSSRLREDFMGRTLRSSDPIQSKITNDPFSPAGMPEEKHLLRQISQKWTLSQLKNEHSFRLQLEPEMLGELQIDISVHQKGIVAEIVTKHPFVKELLERNQELLRGTLAEQGMKVDRFSVSIGDPGQAALGWENHLRKQGTDIPYYASERSSLQSTEEGELSSEQLRMKGGAWSAINIYV